MLFKISNFLNVIDAAIELDRITLLAGPNGNAKSSICMAIGGLLSGKPAVYKIPQKDIASVIVRTGQKQSMVKVEDGDNQVGVILPDGKITSVGQNPPALSAVTSGLQLVMDLNDKDRQNFLSELLQALPTKEQFVLAIKDAKLSDKKIEEIWENIKGLGWDSAHKDMQEKGAKLKAEWEGIAGEKYGSKQAATW